MLYRIPLQATPNQTVNVVLGEQNCTIYIYYNYGNMYMTLAVDGEVVQAGMILQEANIYPVFQSPKFSGFLFFIDHAIRRDPIYTAFEDSIYLYYAETADDIEEWLS